MKVKLPKEVKGPMTLSQRIRRVLESEKWVRVFAYEIDTEGNPSNTQVEVFLRIATIDNIILASIKAAERGDINATKFLLERGYGKEIIQQQTDSDIITFHINTSKLTPEEYKMLIEFEHR